MDEVREMSDGWNTRICRVSDLRYMGVYMSQVPDRCSRGTGEFSLTTTQ